MIYKHLKRGTTKSTTKKLAVNFLTMSGSDNMDNLIIRIHFVDDPVIALS